MWRVFRNTLNLLDEEKILENQMFIHAEVSSGLSRIFVNLMIKISKEGNSVKRLMLILCSP